MKKNNKITFWKIIRILSLLPFIYVFLKACYYGLQPEGIEFFMTSKVYGLQAFICIVFLYVVVYKEVVIISLILFITACIKCKRKL